VVGARGGRSGVSLVFTDGRLGIVDLSRSGCYGYDITTELICTKGTARVGCLETPRDDEEPRGARCRTSMERFERAYTAQLQNFARNVRDDAVPPIGIDDGIAAPRSGLEATRANQTHHAVEIRGA
jgi:scyllo-inositol 2-dehydrogenase (NAD+)